MAKKIRVAHSHAQNRQDAIPLGNPGSSSYRDRPLSDDEGDSRGRGLTKIVSYVNPSKNVKPYGHAGVRTYVRSEVVAQASYKKNVPLFSQRSACSSQSGYPRTTHSSTHSRQAAVSDGNSSRSTAKSTDRRHFPIAGSSDTTKHSYFLGSHNSNSRTADRNNTSLQHHVQTKKQRPVPPPIPRRNPNTANRKANDLPELYRKHRTGSGSSLETGIDPLDKIFKSSASMEQHDVNLLNHNRSSRTDEETPDNNTSIIKKKRVTFEDDYTSAYHSVSLPIGCAIPTSVADMDRPASAFSHKRRQMTQTSISDVPISKMHSKGAATSSKVSRALASTISVKKINCGNEARTTDQLTMLGSFDSSKRVWYSLRKFSDGFEGSTKLTYKDLHSDAPDPLVYVRSNSAKNKAGEAESSGTLPYVAVNKPAKVNVNLGSTNSQVMSGNPVIDHSMKPEENYICETLKSATALNGNVAVNRECQYIKEEPSGAVDGNDISSSKHCSTTDIYVKQEPACDIICRNEILGIEKTSDEAADDPDNLCPNYLRKVKSDELPQTSAIIKQEQLDDGSDVVFLAHLTGEGVREITRTVEMNVTSNVQRSSSQNKQIMPLLAAQNNYHAYTYPVPYGYNSPVTNWNWQFPSAHYDPSRPPPFVPTPQTFYMATYGMNLFSFPPPHFTRDSKPSLNHPFTSDRSNPSSQTRRH